MDIEKLIEDGDTEELKILCPYCNQIWTAKMEADLDYSMGSEYTGIYGEEVSLEIKCSNCKRVIYTKGNILLNFIFQTIPTTTIMHNCIAISF